MFGSLLRARRFAPLFWCQFFSAFNDNLLRNAVIVLILFGLGGAQSGVLIALAGVAIKAPSFVLSGLGGELADRYDKATVAQRLKLVEIGVAALAAGAFALRSMVLLFLASFLFGVIATLFGPIKYGILPDHLTREQLPAGNALVEGATFLAILLGTLAGALTLDPLYFAGVIIAFAVAAWLTSLLIPPSGEGAPGLVVRVNVLASTLSTLAHLRAETRLWWGGIVTSWFWLVGIVMLSLLPVVVKASLSGTQTVVAVMLAVFSVAIALGSGLAAWLAAGRIILSLSLLGVAAMGLFCLDLGWTTSSFAVTATDRGLREVLSSAAGIRLVVDFCGLAIGGGLFIVPVFAAVQAWAGADYRARVVAAVNVLNSGFMVAGGLAVALLQKLGLGIPALCVLIGLANLGVAVVIYLTMPIDAARDFLLLFARSRAASG